MEEWREAGSPFGPCHLSLPGSGRVASLVISATVREQWVSGRGPIEGSEVGRRDVEKGNWSRAKGREGKGRGLGSQVRPIGLRKGGGWGG